MPLSDVECRNAKPDKKPYKLTDSQGLYLAVTPNGSKLWRMKYRYFGKERSLSIGAYHDRMPVITDDVDGWLDLKRDAISDIAEISFEEYQVRPMNPAMNKAAEKDLSVIEAWPE